jgi:PAS domain-containing protein
MRTEDLEPFRSAPFLLWAKDADGVYVWGNRTIDELAGETVTGKPDSELAWADDAEALRRDDEQVLATGEPMFVHEHVQRSHRGDAVLSVCKWSDDLDGEPHAFGISFVIESPS